MNIFLKISLIALFFIVYIGFNSFTSNADSYEFRAIKITSTWEFPKKTGGHLTFTRSPDLIYSNEYEILREPYEITHNYFKNNKLGQQIPDEKHPSTIEIDHSYFIYKKGKKNGIHYSSISDSTGKIYAVDSLIKDFLHFPSFFYRAKAKGKDSTKVIKDIKNGYLTEIITNRRISDRDPDSSYYYFRKKPLDYSFLIIDKRPDNMYLYKAVIVYNHMPKADNINNITEEKTKCRLSFELREVDVPDRKNLNIMIDRFNKASAF